MPSPKNTKARASSVGQLIDRRGRRLAKFEVSEIRKNIGRLWGRVNQKDAVAITQNGQPVAIMVSAVGFLDLLFGKPMHRSRRVGRKRHGS